MWKISWMSLVVAMITVACGAENEDYTPKPRGFFRIDLPAQEYSTLDLNCPFSFEINRHAKWDPKRQECWGDVYYPELQARLQLTYKSVDSSNRDQLLEEGRELAYKHTVMADGIDEKLYNRPEDKVSGLLYVIEGDAASNLQFFMTDSTQHFLRGVLYFYAEPNADSLRPVNQFMREEVAHLIETLEWQNSSP